MRSGDGCKRRKLRGFSRPFCTREENIAIIGLTHTASILDAQRRIIFHFLGGHAILSKIAQPLRALHGNFAELQGCMP